MRLVTNTPRMYHITPILEDLPWLPIKYRIEFKILLLTFKCLYGLAPHHLVDVAPQSRYNLRSRNASLLVPAKARCLPTLGDRAFQSAAPKLWNSLPAEIRNIQTLTSFKQAIKTYFLIDLFIHIFFIIAFLIDLLILILLSVMRIRKYLYCICAMKWRGPGKRLTDDFLKTINCI